MSPAPHTPRPPDAATPEDAPAQPTEPEPVPAPQSPAPQPAAPATPARGGRQAAVSVRKALDLLDAFTGAQTPQNLSDIARAAALPKSTALRLLGQLVESGFLTRAGTRYCLSLRAFELGIHALTQHTAPLRDIAAPYLGSLFQQTSLTVNLSILDGAEVLWVDKLHGLRTPRTPNAVGARTPAAVSASGKAMLAFASREVLRAALGEPAGIRTARGPIAPGLFLNQLKGVRRTAIAYDHEESSPGLTCIASPILLDGAPLAAVSVSGPSGRLAPEALAPLVLRTADRIAHDLPASR